jgi:hypothetical protein
MKLKQLLQFGIPNSALRARTPSVATIPIPTISVTNTPTSVKEGGTATLGVKLSGTISSDTKVTITSSNTTSVSVTPASITFTSSNATTDQIVTLTGLQDKNSISESFTLTLSSSGLVDVVLNITTTDDDCYAWGCFADNENGTISFTGAGTLAGTNLVWMKCSQGQTYDTSNKVCTGTAGTYQYCSTLTNDCNGGNASLNLQTPFSNGQTSQVYITCDTLNLVPAGGFAGKMTWRVPTKDELKTLVYCSSGPDTPLADFRPCLSGHFNTTINSSFSLAAYYYWSSTPYASSFISAWTVYFYDGTVNWGSKNFNGNVLCVSTSP